MIMYFFPFRIRPFLFRFQSFTDTHPKRPPRWSPTRNPNFLGNSDDTFPRSLQWVRSKGKPAYPSLCVSLPSPHTTYCVEESPSLILN